MSVFGGYPTSFESLEKRKEKLRILILGPYRPNWALDRLETLKQSLIQRRFGTTRLVKDFADELKYDEDPDIHFTKKSRWLIEYWANVPIFVFFKDGDNLGVGNELGYTCLSLPEKTSYSVVFVETSLNIGSQVRGTIKLGTREEKLSYEDFKTDEELCSFAFGHCRKILDRLFYYLEE